MITIDFIKEYIFDNYKDVKHCEIIKKNNKYIGKITKTNPRFNREAYRRYVNDSNTEPEDIFLGCFLYITVLFVTSLLCGIPHIIGVLLFTIINITLVTLFILDFNIYDKTIWIVIAICMFLITIFVAHFVLIANISENHNAKNAVEAYKAFHTIYPEYLFKFKFK